MSAKELAAAAAAGDLAAVKQLSKNDPEAVRHWKPLMDASFRGRPKVVRELLRRGADVNVLSGNPARHRPIHRVVEHKATIPKGPGHLEVARILCEAGADLELAGGGYRWRPLAAAANGAQPDYVELLLRHGAKRDVFTSASILDVARVRRFLARDPGLCRARDEQGRTPLHYLCASGMHETEPRGVQKCLKIAELLLDAGAEADAEWASRDGQPKTPKRPLWWAVSWRKNTPLVELLLERGADARAQLHEAAVESTPEILELLVAHGAPVDLKRDGRTPLLYLIGHRMPANARWFLERGAHPNAKARDGTTPLHVAAAVGVRQEVLEALIEHGARPSVKDRRGRTALAAARAAGNKRAVSYLQSL